MGWLKAGENSASAPDGWGSVGGRVTIELGFAAGGVAPSVSASNSAFPSGAVASAGLADSVFSTGAAAGAERA